MSKPLPPAENEQPAEPEPEINQTVDEEENTSQNTSIQRIQKFRDHLAEYQVWFAQNEISQEVSREDQLRSYHRMTQGFLRVLTPYLTDDRLTPAAGDTDADQPNKGNYYWNRVNLGSFTVDPPNILQKPGQRTMERAIRNHDTAKLARADSRTNADPRRFAVAGLRDFAASDPELSVSWTVMFGPEVEAHELRSELSDPNATIRPRNHRTEPIEVDKTVQLPKSIIDNAVTAMENFVRELGLDIDFEEEEQQTKIDRDLLEEVDEWRRNNVGD